MRYDDLIGLPYAPGGNGPEAFDCFGLVVEVRRRMGLPTPVGVPHECMPRNQPRATDAVLRAAVAEGGWQPVPVPVPGDVVALGNGGRVTAFHIGVIVGDGAAQGVLHASEGPGGAGQVVLTPLAALRALYSRVEVLRYGRV